MARLSDEVIDRIKNEIDLLALVASQGFKPKSHGKDKVIPCPFHQDETASCVITPSKNLFNCFGCGAAGTVIDWTMRTQGVSFRHACELLQNDLGIISEVKSVKNSSTKKIPSSLAANSDNQTALDQVITFYEQTLGESQEAMAYLAQRGLTHPVLIRQFRLGFANRTLAYQLPDKNRQAGAKLRGQLQEIGILRKTGHEHFNGSLVVPVINSKGQITEVYGRKIVQNLRKGTAKHLYLPGPHEGIWNETGLAESDEVILCEAIIDAMTFWVYGFRNVTASYGTGGFTDYHLAAFKQRGIKRVLIAYDRDEAGNTAAEKLVEPLTEQGMAVYRIEVPKDMDINEYALSVKTPGKSLGALIRKASKLGDALPVEVQAVEENQPVEVQGGHIVDTETGEILDVTSVENQPAKPAARAEPTPAKPVQVEVPSVEIQPTKPAARVEPAPVKPVQVDVASIEIQPAEPAARAEPAPAITIDADVNDHEVTIALANRIYRIRGLAKNLSYAQLKINLLVRTTGQTVTAEADQPYHVDTLDLYSNKARYGFIKQAGIELGVAEDVIKHDLGKVLMKLEELQEKQITDCLEPKEQVVNLTETETAEALELLKDPTLLSRILADFDACGVIGEETNKLVGYLACVSRKLDRPLAIIIQSSSAAGKSSLMDAILNLIPDEEKIQYSAMTGQSLFYMGETNLKHKVLAIAEEEGANQASYALKLLQSEGVISIASTGKDESTGQMITREYRVEGPVMLFLTTTAIDIDEELMNRCLVLTVNESREQTQAIHRQQRQRRTLAGLSGKVKKNQLVHLHQNAQRLLKPLAVVNPYAEQLGFLDNQTRTRRDHEKYLNLIDSIAFLHQYQRKMKTLSDNGSVVHYIEVTLDDIRHANRLIHEVLGRTLDELPPQTRKLLDQIRQLVSDACKAQKMKQADFRFSRREVREATQWGNTQLKVHLNRLEDMEYLLVHKGGRGSTLVYELQYQGESAERFMMGLIDVDQFITKDGYDTKKSGINNEKSGSSRPQVGAVSAPSRPDETSLQPSKSNGSASSSALVA